MNSTQYISEIDKKFYIFYLDDEKPKILKKETELKAKKSLSNLKAKGIDGYFCINIETFDFISSNYSQITQDNAETKFLDSPYVLIVKIDTKLHYYVVDD